MRSAVERGLEGDLRSASGLVGGDALLVARSLAGPMSNSLFSDVLARALAVQEVNAAMGVIVAAPTAGGAGVLPAVLTGLARNRTIGDEAVIDALADEREGAGVGEGTPPRPIQTASRACAGGSSAS